MKSAIGWSDTLPSHLPEVREVLRGDVCGDLTRREISVGGCRFLKKQPLCLVEVFVCPVKIFLSHIGPSSRWLTSSKKVLGCIVQLMSTKSALEWWGWPFHIPLPWSCICCACHLLQILSLPPSTHHKLCGWTFVSASTVSCLLPSELSL
jgi:hypothetical protein